MNHMLRRLPTLIATTCLVIVTLTNPPAASTTSRLPDIANANATFFGPPLRSTAAVAPGNSAAARTAETLALATCPSGWYCFYDETGFGQPVGKLSSCGWQSLATWGWQNRINAAYYNLASGSASFYEGNGTYLFQVSATSRSLSDVYPLQNRADKVYRYCP
jgi:hypothetical protein